MATAPTITAWRRCWAVPSSMAAWRCSSLPAHRSRFRRRRLTKPPPIPPDAISAVTILAHQRAAAFFDRLQCGFLQPADPIAGYPLAQKGGWMLHTRLAPGLRLERRGPDNPVDHRIVMADV